MEAAANILNYFKTKFKTLLILSIVTLGLVAVQHIGHYESFLWKYGIGLFLSIPLAFLWYWIEGKFSKNLESDHQRSAIWIVLFLMIIPIGMLHVLKQEWNYTYHIPMCDCEESDTRKDRVGAICEDGFKSYSTGRGTCSEHDGVEKWQCDCD